MLVAVALDWVGVLSRFAHVLAGIVLVGGIVFLRCVLVPSDEREASDLLQSVRNRWSRLVMMATALLLLSGFYNLVIIVKNYEVPGIYHGLFGIKFLLALFVFIVAALLSGRTEAAERFRQRAKGWLNACVVAAVALVAIASVMRMMEKTPKETEKETRAAGIHVSRPRNG